MDGRNIPEGDIGCTSVEAVGLMAGPVKRFGCRPDD